VGHRALKKRVDSVTPTPPAEIAPSTFVEIRTSPEPMDRRGSCHVEFERTSGEKMRVQLGSACDTDLARLTRLFLGEAR